MSALCCQGHHSNGDVSYNLDNPEVPSVHACPTAKVTIVMVTSVGNPDVTSCPLQPCFMLDELVNGGHWAKLATQHHP